MDPDAATWAVTQVTHALSLAPRSIVFIDDRPANVESALLRTLGLLP